MKSDKQWLVSIPIADLLALQQLPDEVSQLRALLEEQTRRTEGLYNQLYQLMEIYKMNKE